MEKLFAGREVVIFCGSGGVGKTTTAAAAAATVAVRQGGKVLVLTVDPAKRLANALGLAGFGNTETQVPPAAFAAAGVKPRGELWAAMLDTKESWDNLVRRDAPDAETARRILENPLYQNISGKFVQSHDYIAMERLYDLYSAGTYDLIVIDTPPTRNAIDFIEAPQRMADFFSSRFLRLLIAPARSKVINFATRPFYQVADRILGTQFLQDIAEFFILFQSMYEGFVRRAREVETLLHNRRTSFVVVTTLEPAPAAEAEFFVRALTDRKFHLGAVIFNKVLPSYLLGTESVDGAKRLCETSGELAASLPSLGEPAQVERVLREVGESFLRFHVVAEREAEQRGDLANAAEELASVPYFDTDIHDLAGLLRLGEAIFANG
ncbi:MAG TPA: ArsA-related P-loop ATPase [Acidimicrobiales bacterium]|jgi:anion-transporting  ArsA/GET3 family ATPase|nr:ArsA-related P-loop ATPase [Acidimicrobiales bacterium]